MNKQLTVIVPAYNEQKRIIPTIATICHELTAKDIDYELLVIDDGSTDNTAALINDISTDNPRVKLISMIVNSGKGAAIKRGVFAAGKEAILYCDADGATDFGEVHKFLDKLSDKFPIIIGSRALPGFENLLETNNHRKLMGRIFNFLVNLLLIPNVYDTQCGFKLFKSDVARVIFDKATCSGYAFDVEILYIATKLRIPFCEQPVRWRNIPGSKVSLLIDPFKMFLQLLTIKLRHYRSRGENGKQQEYNRM